MLQSARGAESDRAYLTGQLAGHQELLQIHTALASSSGPAPAPTQDRALSTLAVPAIKTHIALIGMMMQHQR